MYQEKQELMHYGVLGQKWGVRRYQNKDGSLTSAGKRRQQKQLVKDQKKWERNVNNNWHKAYNSAAEKINKRLPEFNAKWEKEFKNYSNWMDSPKYKDYTKDYVNMWNDIYVKELDSTFGKSPISTGRKWAETVPMFMDQDSM